MEFFLQQPVRAGDMRQFFKPVEIDDEMEDNFDLSTIRGNTSAGRNNNTTNSLTEDQFEGFNPTEISLTAENKRITDQMLKELRDSVVENNNVVKTVENSPWDFMKLKEKFLENYSCYYAKYKVHKWDCFNEKLSKSAYNDKSLPPIVKEFVAKLREESNECRVYRTQTSDWSDRTFDDEMVVGCLLSILKVPESKSSPLKNENNIGIGMQSNIFDESQLSVVMQMDYESKYASQLKPQTEPKTSTLDQFMSSTPHKVSSVLGNSAMPIHSPIVNAPLSSKGESEHAKTSDQRVNRINKDDPDWYLKYLRLNSVWDLFSDSEDECLEEVKPIGNKSEEAAKLCDNLNASVCGNDSLIEEESQYTVSRILKICDDAENEKMNKMAPINDESTKTKRKLLYVGSVEDLFCDDDDDDFLNSQILRLSESDGTINYDVEDAMAQIENIKNHSTSLFKDTIDGETSHKSTDASAKPVTLVKSDDLFSTYNESVANTSKGNASNVKNVTKNNESTKQEQRPPEQDIHTTPKKSNNSNFFAYYSRSPSVLIRTTSVLSTKFDNNHANKSTCNNNSKNSSTHSDKSPELLSSKLSVLNTQLSLSKHFDDSDDFEEIKENFDVNERFTPFATCNQQQKSSTQTNDFYCDTDMSDDDIFATCKLASV